MKRKRRNPRNLRHETQHQLIARLLLLGWTGERIARRVGRSSRAVRYTISTPRFLELFDRLQQEQLKSLDRKMSRLLHSAVKELAKRLKHKDWRARDAAAEKILRMHAKFVERIDITGSVDHKGAIGHAHQHQLAMGPDWTEEQRTVARLLLQSMKPTQQRTLPPVFARGLSRHEQDQEDRSEQG
jgi:hypothetical protein